MHCTVSCWILVEPGDREWVSNGGEGLIWEKHDVYRPEVPRQNPLELLVYTYFFLNEWQEGKRKLFQGWVPVGDGWAQGRMRVYVVDVFSIHIWK
jgi:hypothetical protein